MVFVSLQLILCSSNFLFEVSSMSTEEQEAVATNAPSNQPKKPTPIPWGQVIPLIAVRLSEPINFRLILPFLYPMIARFGIAKTPKDISFYAGLLFTAFSFCQTTTIMFWGRLSDRIGRRPVLMFGLAGNLIASLLLGTASSFWVAVAARAMNGLMAGNAAVIKSIMAEISDSSNRSSMMAMTPLAFNIGTMTGTTMGGLLADPAHQYPSVFGNFAPFIKFPYLLPFLVGAAVTLFGLVMVLLKVKETLAKKTQPVLLRETTSLLETPSQQKPKQKSIKELLTPTVIRSMGTNVLMCIAMSMSDQLYPIFAATPTKDGGLGFDTRSIGFSLVVDGIAVFYLQLVLYPKWERKYGALACYRWGQKLIIPFMLLLPFLSSLANRAEANTGGRFETCLLWLSLILLLLVKITGQVLAFTSINMITANIAPSKNDLGSMNGMQQLAMSSTRIIGPLLSGTLWSWSLKQGLPYPFDYHFAWTVGAIFAVGSLFMTYQLPESVNTFLSERE